MGLSLLTCTPYGFTAFPVTYFPNETTFFHAFIYNLILQPQFTLTVFPVPAAIYSNESMFIYFQWEECDAIFFFMKGNAVLIEVRGTGWCALQTYSE